MKIGLHRHTGVVHAYNPQGEHRPCTGEVIGPNGYVYEPAGNVDWCQATGTGPLIVFVVVMAPSST